MQVGDITRTGRPLQSLPSDTEERLGYGQHHEENLWCMSWGWYKSSRQGGLTLSSALVIITKEFDDDANFFSFLHYYWIAGLPSTIGQCVASNFCILLRISRNSHQLAVPAKNCFLEHR